MCSLLYLIRQTILSLVLCRQREFQDIQFLDMAKYKSTEIEDIISFGCNRFELYKRMKYNVMALEI